MDYSKQMARLTARKNAQTREKLAKLGARDRVDAVNRAVARGLVPPRA